jgi:hypothetical protein
MTCAVLRCADPTSHIEVITEQPLRSEVPFCAAHWAKADAGDPWVVDYQHQAQKLVVLMGEDMPLRFEKLGMRDHIASPNHVEVTLTLKRWDGSDELVNFVVPRDKCAEFTALAGMGDSD